MLDRQTGEFLSGRAYAKQTWAKGLDDSGRPIVLPNTDPTVEGNLIWPSLAGGTNWYSPSYSPQTDLFYVAVREMGSYYYKGEAEYKPGTFFGGGGERALDGDEAWGAIRALNPINGKMKRDRLAWVGRFVAETKAIPKHRGRANKEALQ